VRGVASCPLAGTGARRWTSHPWPIVDAVTGPGVGSGTNIALYRKYRSATFAELIGQDHVTGPLSQALNSQRINHAYLFSGPRGCGKTSSARILARSLNCVQGPTATPCGVCASCIELAPNGSGSIDVIEIDAASHNGVDDARELRERAFFAPARDRYKVYILDEAHMVTAQGFNALLKLVEEPPEFVVFIFATTEPEKVLQTIRSRTHHYPFRLVPPSVMRAHLERVCRAEGVAAEPAVLPLVVRAGGGSVRDSLSILDQLLAGAAETGLTYADAVALLGVTDATLIDDIVDALAAGDSAGVYGTVDRVVEAGHDPRRFAADLLDRFRDLIVLDAVPDAGDRGLLDAPADALAHMADEAARLGGATLTRFAEIVHAALIEMRGTTSPRLVLELLCARMQLPDAAADSAALLQRIERLERRQSVEQAAGGHPVPDPADKHRPPRPASARPKPAMAEPAIAEPEVEAPGPNGAAKDHAAKDHAAKEAHATAHAEPAMAEPRIAGPDPTPDATSTESKPVAPGVLDATGLRRVWTEVLDAVKSGSRSTRALLEGAQISDVDGNLVTLSIAAPPLARLLGEERNAAVIRSGLTQTVGGEWRLAVVVSNVAPVEADDAQPAAPEPAPPPKVEVPPPPTPRPAHERAERPAAAPAGHDDPREDGDSDDPAEEMAASDPELDALRLLESTLDARPLDR
jgi:DNA polymerase III subunit gamma/tau